MCACIGPDRGVRSVMCGLDPHTFRAMRHNARGLRAGGLVVVLGGLRAERKVAAMSGTVTIARDAVIDLLSVVHAVCDVLEDVAGVTPTAITEKLGIKLQGIEET